MTLTQENLPGACAHLAAADPVMAGLIARHGACRLADAPPQPPFHTLVASIIGQQLSVKAADTILGRVAQLAPQPFAPDTLGAVSPERLRAAGMSTRKAACVLEIAQQVAAGGFSFEMLREADDESAIARLVDLPGVGRWTAQMFLLFGLRRADILATGDGGLQRAVRILYGERATLDQVGACWRPYASVASWYLWRALAP